MKHHLLFAVLLTFVVVRVGSRLTDAGADTVEDDAVIVKSESRRLRFGTNAPKSHRRKAKNGETNDSFWHSHNLNNTRGLSMSCGYGNYFCFKTIDEIFIVMTHNSLALPGKVLSPNQNFGLRRQFQDGVRGFNFDLYTARDGSIVTRHGGTVIGYDPRQEVHELVNEIAKNANEFVIIKLQDEMNVHNRDELVTWFGPLLVTNFDPQRNLGEYMVQGQRIILATSKQSNVARDMGVHSTNDLVTENDYQWRSCYVGEPPFAYRRGPRTAEDSRSAKLMNSFCSLSGTGDLVASNFVNEKSRILYNVRNYVKQDYSRGKINILVVDYYETGNVFAAQDAIRSGNMYDGCDGDGSSCMVGSTCWNCCANYNEYWSSKLVTACGYEPCWKPGTVCGIGSTCASCCRGADCRWYHLGVCTCNA